MNYLAHAYLSFGHEPTLVGNLISDFVKGKKKFDYPENIQKGITLHRAIDTFTDNHIVTKSAKNVFRQAYRLYSGAFVDVVYDHFLAVDPKIFTEDSLADFSNKVYGVLDSHRRLLPADFALMFPHMKLHNWLLNYRSKRGTELSFGGLVKRALYIKESATAISLFEEHYETLRDHYSAFFPELSSFAFALFEEIRAE
jgi:acyl carrier protein phosphodiesterase